MCRSIKTLRSTNHEATREDMHNAALQFVRKISGFRKPSKANEKAFSHAVEEITTITDALLRSLMP